MKVFVIYDEAGSVYAVRYGDNQHLPDQLQGIYQHIPDGALIDGVNVLNPENHKIMFTPSPKSVLEKELAKVSASLHTGP